jgi:hypothetical protein
MMKDVEADNHVCADIGQGQATRVGTQKGDG